MLKKFIAPVVLSSALLGSLAIGGAAYAGSATPTTSVTVPAGAQHKVHHWLKSNRRSLRKAAITISATTIGITPEGLVAELKTGKSIAMVAVEHGRTAQDVVGAMKASVEAKVAQAVTAGALTQAQADKIGAALPVRLDKLVNHVF
jgi:hypothetical protein